MEDNNELLVYSGSISTSGRIGLRRRRRRPVIRLAAFFVAIFIIALIFWTLSHKEAVGDDVNDILYLADINSVPEPEGDWPFPAACGAVSVPLWSGGVRAALIIRLICI